jgi:hypothetical protein
MYKHNIRNSDVPMWKPVSLTPAQKAKAQELWSAELRTKTKESARKEREQILVDREYDEWD